MKRQVTDFGRAKRSHAAQMLAPFSIYTQQTYLYIHIIRTIHRKFRKMPNILIEVEMSQQITSCLLENSHPLTAFFLHPHIHTCHHNPRAMCNFGERTEWENEQNHLRNHSKRCESARCLQVTRKHTNIIICLEYALLFSLSHCATSYDTR